MALSRTQRRNIWNMLVGALEYCKHQKFTRRQARQHLRYCLMCIMVESAGWIYANFNVSESFRYHHDRVGSDHYSVGMFQQQCAPNGGWGPCEVCMSPAGSAHNFLRDLTRRGLDKPYAKPSAFEFGRVVQTVQVSAFPDRYEAFFGFSNRYLHYNFRFRRLLKTVNYPKDK